MQILTALFVGQWSGYLSPSDLEKVLEPIRSTRNPGRYLRVFDV